MPQTLSFEGIARNFRFLIIQVKKQLENTERLLERPDSALVKALQDSEDYVDTQKSMIENECFDFIGKRAHSDEQTIDTVRAVNVITSNLERISDFSVNIARQLQHLTDHSVLGRFDHGGYLDQISRGLDLIADALFERDSTLALRICRLEDNVDRHYRSDLQAIIAALRASRDVEDLVTTLFILHYLERMGDALLNIGEAVLFAVMGERLKINQYRALDEAVAATPALDRALNRVDVSSIWGTRSGTRVGTLSDARADAQSDATQRVLFKEGNPDKLRREKESLTRWQTVAPGVAPKVVEFQQQGTDAALLLQYLDGTTLQDIILNGEDELITGALHCVEQTLIGLWTDTLQTEPVNGRYLEQLRARVDDVYRLHPALRETEIHLGDARLSGFAALLERLAGLDEALTAPFRLFIHGDFNLDNIIYNRATDTMHVVDVHRSRDMDYVQDVSVFLISNYRQPVFVPATRRRFEAVARRFLAFAREFAARRQDATFEARLALGLARSVITSMRFELNRPFARSMQLRATYLLRRLDQHQTAGAPWEQFRTPEAVLSYW